MPSLFIEQDQILDVEQNPLLAEFFKKVLGKDIRDCLLTDLSELTDFGFSGLSAAQLEAQPSYEACLQLWDTYVVEQLALHFGVHLDHTGISIIQLSEKLCQAAKTATLH